jgi:hypothetical protein
LTLHKLFITSLDIGTYLQRHMNKCKDNLLEKVPTYKVSRYLLIKFIGNIK